jgi:NADPH:quinone reductase-like Zn-dependent oxidoreductase
VTATRSSPANDAMPAALIDRLGGLPRAAEAPRPQRGPGEALVQVAAAALNPLDIHIASGRFYAGPPEVPYVPGKEGVGVVVAADHVPVGTRVWFEARGGIGGGGAMAAAAAVEEEKLIPVVGDVDDAAAAALGIAGIAAWNALEWRAQLQPGETVLVLGASGAVGSLAIQIARILGAAVVVAAARDAAGLQRAATLGADATVDLSAGGDLAARLREAAGGDIDVTVDPLCGDALTAASVASATHARIVQLGEAAAPTATLASGVLRGKMLTLLGHSHFGTPADRKAAAYRHLVDHAAGGRLHVECESFDLSAVGDAWQRQATSPHRKLVLRLDQAG